jgi:hypothetical protein
MFFSHDRACCHTESQVSKPRDDVSGIDARHRRGFRPGIRLEAQIAKSSHLVVREWLWECQSSDAMTSSCFDSLAMLEEKRNRQKE